MFSADKPSACRIHNVKEKAGFLIKEMQDMAQRLDAAFLLAAGENYQSISKTVGISTATISRVSRCLNYGRGGYQDAIRKMTEKNDAE